MDARPAGQAKTQQGAIDRARQIVRNTGVGKVRIDATDGGANLRHDRARQ
jgi:non-canonical (house-cleaning) NTP pyrophosphatase